MNKPTMLVLAALAALPLAGCGGDTAAHPVNSAGRAETAKPPPPGTVRIQLASRRFLEILELQERDGTEAIVAPARIEFRDDAIARVGAPIEGRITRFHVRVGDEVEEGDPLFTMQSPEAAAARADLTRAAATVRAARGALGRQERLLDRGVGIEAELLATRTALAEAEAEAARARQVRRFLGPGHGSTVVVRAPIEGTLIRMETTVGAAVEPGGSPLMTIGDTAALWVVANVFERELEQVRPGTEARVKLAGMNEPVPGRVVSVGAMLTAGSRRAPVHVELEPRSDLLPLRAGMFAHATLLGDPLDGLTVPVSAVLIKDGRRTVAYVERDELEFEQREIIIGESVRGQVRVLSGLSPGERIVALGAILLDGEADELL